MLFSFSKFIRNITSLAKISRNCNMNLDKCYFRYDKVIQKVDITFLFKIKDSARQFNFNRRPSESLQTLFTRIESNIQKIKKKSKGKKGIINIEDEKIDINFFDADNQTISQELSCLELFDLRGPLKLEICNHVYEVIFNSPWVANLSLPKSLLVGFCIYPENLKILNTLREKSHFIWYKGFPKTDKGNAISDNHINWTLIGRHFSYTPNSTDVGMKIKLECIPANDTITGPLVEAISKNVVEAGPGPCPFETRHLFTSEKLKGFSFRCISYNILADLYCDSDYTRTVLHPYCPAYALQIDYRKQLILKELLGYNADIICLQEVDNKIFHNALNPFLEVEGLQGQFYKKGKEVAEGLACFYRKTRFQFLEEKTILLASALKTEPCLQPIWNAIKHNQPLVERVLDRSTVASATVLQSIDKPNEILIVANTHLYFHPDADHIRLLQGGIVIYWLQGIRKHIIKEYPEKRTSLILCGDFNSVPSCGIYQLYTTGTAPESLPDWNSNVSEAVKNLSLSQDILLGSACGTPPFTNFTVGFADCLDYIFYDKANLEVEQVIPLPDVEELKVHTALPSIVFPSDHIALVSDLRFL